MDEDEKEGREEVCVCVTLGIRGILLDLFVFLLWFPQQGAPGAEIGQVPTKTPISCS